MLYTESPSQDIHKLPSSSSKKGLPNWVARRGMYWIMACRTRQDLSSASSTIAGSKLSDNNSIPITDQDRRSENVSQMQRTQYHR